MTTTMEATQHESATPIRGKIVEAEVKVSVDATKPLPLACALYAIESAHGVWLCAYYGANRSVFDSLPQKGAEVDESRLGIAFHTRRLVPQEEYQPSVWEEFKKANLLTYGGHKE
jgi:hypothetical protein